MQKFILATILLLCAVAIGQRTVQQVLDANGCSTAPVVPISRQLIDQMQCLRPGLFKSIAGVSGISLGPAASPFLQSPAADALIRAQRRRGVTMSINSSLRSIIQQLLLFRWAGRGLCGIQAAATPGNSNHNGALAVDINDARSWISAMRAENWIWFGEGDVPHFDFRGSGTVDIRSLSVRSFQILWNLNNPNDRISEDGVYGPATESRILRSPISGFARGATCGSGNVAPPNIGGGPTSCTANGVQGTCIDTAQCTGTSTPGLCPGAANIQCCTNSPPVTVDRCSVSGVQGTCIDVGQCVAPNRPTPGLCPGGSNIQCCANVPAPPAGLTTSQSGIDLIKSFEGFEDRPRPDPVGIPTVGFGHNCIALGCDNMRGKTAAGTFYTITVPLTRQEGEDLLRADLAPFEACVNRRLTRTITQNQFDALVSFTFNVGCGAFQTSTLLTRVNSNAPLEGPTGIREAFSRFNRGGGQVLPGLVRRRNEEADLYGGITGGSGGSTTDCFVNGVKGVCMDIADCTGTRTAGVCPGPSNIQCCVGHRCTANGVQGRCVSRSTCRGTSTAGLCPGSSDIQCCTGSSAVGMNAEQTPIATPASSCPDGATWDDTFNFCRDTNKGVVYGPFTNKMIQKCITFGGGNACSNRVPVPFNNGQTFINLLVWEQSFAQNLRGNGDCPDGAERDPNTMGFCVEFANETDPVSNQTLVRRWTFGSFGVADICNSLNVGAACLVPRWDGDFVSSLLFTKTRVAVIPDSVLSDDPDSVEYGNPWVDAQLAANNEAEVVPEAATSDAQTMKMINFVCLIFLIVACLF